jgi:hypothetical protein
MKLSILIWAMLPDDRGLDSDTQDLTSGDFLGPDPAEGEIIMTRVRLTAQTGGFSQNTLQNSDGSPRRSSELES